MLLASQCTGLNAEASLETVIIEGDLALSMNTQTRYEKSDVTVRGRVSIQGDASLSLVDSVLMIASADTMITVTGNGRLTIESTEIDAKNPRIRIGDSASAIIRGVSQRLGAGLSEDARLESNSTN